MRKTICIFLFCFASCHMQAQEKKASTLFGMSVGLSPLAPMKTRIPTFKLGVQSFSYSTSLENRLTLKKKLNFSLQYSLNYTHFRNTPNLFNTEASRNIISTNISASSLYELKKDVTIVTGAGIQKPFQIESSNIHEIPHTLITKKNTGKYSLKNLQDITPYFIIGIENSTKLFNKNLYYSLQYNFGFMPLKYKVIEEGSTETERSQGGVQIGLKYKY